MPNLGLGLKASQELQELQLQVSETQGSLVVISIDIDGCLFSRRLVDRLKEEKLLKLSESFLPPPFPEKILIKTNEGLLFKLTDSIITPSVAHVIVLSGSNRQSHYLDTLNGRLGGCGKGTGSSFPALNAFTAELNKRTEKARCRFDPFLLADLYNNLEAGKSLKESSRLNAERKKGSKFEDESFKNHTLNDLTKMALVYAQIHHVFSQAKNQTGAYHFFDDKKEILWCLQAFYESYPGLLPQGVTLNLHLYDGEDIKNCNPIRGEGMIDFAYQKSILYFAKLSLHLRSLEPMEKVLQPGEETLKAYLEFFDKKQFDKIRKMNFAELILLSNDPEKVIDSMLRAQYVYNLFDAFETNNEKRSTEILTHLFEKKRLEKFLNTLPPDSQDNLPYDIPKQGYKGFLEYVEKERNNLLFKLYQARA